MKMTAVIGCTASSPQNGVFPGNCSGSLRMNSLQTKHSISGSYHPSRGIFISKAMSIGAVPGINSNHLNYGIRIIHFFRGYQGFPQRRDQRHSGPFHHVPHRFRNPPHRISLLRGHGRPGQRFSVARAAGSGKLHRNVRHPAASAPGRAGIRRNTPVRCLRRDNFRRMV